METNTSLSAIIISRFMLHLQQAHTRTRETVSQEPTSSNADTLRFERALGSLGASILPDDYFAENEDDLYDNIEESHGFPADGAVTVEVQVKSAE